MAPVTPQVKDKVLNYLCEQMIPEAHMRMENQEILDALQIDIDTLNAILNQFQRRGLISEVGVGAMATYCNLRLDALDFKSRGGFTMQEELLENESEKLLLEVERLRKELGPDYFTKFEKLTSIAVHLSSLISGIHK